MEQRKLIQHGLSSLTIAIPANWVKKRNLKKGDYVFVKEDQDSLIIKTTNSKYFESKKINLENLDRTSITLAIQQAYRIGYKEIEIKYENDLIVHLRKNEKIHIAQIVQEITQRLIGFEIIRTEKNLFLIRQLTNENHEDMDNLLRRIFLLLIEISNKLRLQLNNKTELIEIENLHRSINNLSNYYLRLLNLYGHKDSKQTKIQYFVISSIEKIVDIIKYNSRFYSKNKQILSENSLKQLKKIEEAIQIYYSLYYKPNNSKILEFSKLRNEVKFEIEKNILEFSKYELVILISQKQILELLMDLIYFE
jgi:phosphate uptake regulator